MSDIVGGSYEITENLIESEWKCPRNVAISSNPPRQSSWSESGDYIVLLDNGNGEIVFSKRFLLQADSIEDQWASEEYFSYSLHIPTFPDIRSIDLRHYKTNESLCRYDFDPEKKPVVTFTHVPSGSIDESFQLRWDTVSLPGQKISYKLHYSHDNGRSDTWQELPGYMLDPNKVRGSLTSSVIRIIASDGINYAVDTSDLSFYVPMKAPEVSISGAGYPYYREGVGGKLSVQLGGVDGRHIPDDNIAWYSNRDGMVGTGSSYSGKNLSVGEHDISIQVTALDGQMHLIQITTVDVAGDSPAINVRVGDGTSYDLACNEVEVDAKFVYESMDSVSYGFNKTPDESVAHIYSMDDLPLRYQMTEAVWVNVFAVNRAGLTDKYSQRLELLDCVER